MFNMFSTYSKTKLKNKLKHKLLHPYLFGLSLRLSLPIYSQCFLSLSRCALSLRLSLVIHSQHLLSLDVPKSAAVLCLCCRNCFIGPLLLLHLRHRRCFISTPAAASRMPRLLLLYRLRLCYWLSGVIDDKGKYIYISQEEMKAVANYIRRRGRVSISYLASKSNQFIDLE